MEQKFLKPKFDMIVQLLKEYSFYDIIKSLFAIILWNNNNSAILKQIFIIISLISIEEFEFENNDKIFNYFEFKKFTQSLLSNLPEFPTLEDYCPEKDWGEIKFFHNNFYYKIFYGSEICNIYDYLQCFKLVHGSLKNFYQNNNLENPGKDLEIFLSLQNQTIEDIKTQKNNEVEPGQISLPSRVFWKESQVCFYYLMKKINKQDNEFLNKYSIKVGDKEQVYKKLLNFETDFLEGELLNHSFICYKGNYYPIIPRRFSYVLCKYWNNQLDNLIITKKFSLNEYELIKSAIKIYIRERKTHNIQFIDNINEYINNKKLKNISCSAIIINNEVILFYFLNPTIKDEETHLFELYNLLKSEIISSLHLPQDFDVQLIIVNMLFPFENAIVNFPVHKNIFYFPLVDFIQMINELNDFFELGKQLHYLKNNPLNYNPMYSISDKLAFYRENNNGTILTGANNFSYLILEDANYGSSTRFESLKNKYKKFPLLYSIGDPEKWHILPDKNSNKLRLEAKTLLGFIKYQKINNSDICIKPIFGIYNKKQYIILDNITDMVEDIFYHYLDIISKHKFFREYKNLLIEVIPYSVIKENKVFKFLQNKIDNNLIWTFTTGYPDKNTHGIRILYNEDLYFDAMNGAKDSKIETNLAIEIIEKLDFYVPDENVLKIKNKILKHKNDKTRFAFNLLNKPTSFPEHWQVILPEDKDFILVQNKMAKLIKSSEYKPGKYTNNEAKNILQIVREGLMPVLDNELSQIDSTQGISYLIQQMDAYYNETEHKRRLLDISTEHDVDYNRTQRLIEIKNECHHNNIIYRYLIEKFIYLPHIGTKILTKDKLQLLIAEAHWILHTYQYGDIIHNNLTELSLIIKDDYTIYADVSKKMLQKQNKYLEYESENDLYNNLPKEMKFNDEKNYYPKLNEAMIYDFGFSFQLLIDLLSCLSSWTAYKNIDEQPYYTASIPEIIQMLLNKLPNKDDCNEEAIKKLIDFLTLKADEVSKIYEEDFLSTKECNEIPVYEYNKRFSRYMIKPFIKTDENKILWGPQSTYQAKDVWTKNLAYPRFPFGLCACKTKNIIQKQKEKREAELNNNTYKFLLNNWSQYCEKNVYLHNRDKKGNHPENLGDYDVLCYIPKKNCLLNIECKYYLKPYCLKDAKRLLNNVLKPDKKSKKNSLEKVKNREIYLENNLNKIFEILKWPIPKDIPKIHSLYVVTDSELFEILLNDTKNIKFINLKYLNSYINTI